ncbi:MAG: Mur ligase family protein, partial [Burkholderiales bacterium]
MNACANAMFSTREAAAALGAGHLGADAPVLGVGTDSRHVERGSLFVALRGERFDGHEFVAGALASGATAAMVDGQADVGRWPGASLVVVEDTKAGLGELARWWRSRFALPAIGVVGSNGKTTTKEMTASVLTAQYGAVDVLATVGNLNNDIGLPLTVLRLRAHHRAAVLELGMNHPGETATLAAIAQPTVALITNAQREHQEFMKS